MLHVWLSKTPPPPQSWSIRHWAWAPPDVAHSSSFSRPHAARPWDEFNRIRRYAWFKFGRLSLFLIHTVDMPVEKENFRLGKYSFILDLQRCSWKSLESLGQGISGIWPQEDLKFLRTDSTEEYFTTLAILITYFATCKDENSKNII